MKTTSPSGRGDRHGRNLAPVSLQRLATGSGINLPTFPAIVELVTHSSRPDAIAYPPDPWAPSVRLAKERPVVPNGSGRRDARPRRSRISVVVQRRRPRTATTTAILSTLSGNPWHCLVLFSVDMLADERGSSASATGTARPERAARLHRRHTAPTAASASTIRVALSRGATRAAAMSFLRALRADGLPRSRRC